MSDAATLMDQGLQSYQAQDFNQAVASLQDLVEQEPTNWEAWRLLGFSLSAAGDHDKAIQAFKQAIRINKQDPDNYYGLGMAERSLQNHREATAALEEAYNLDHNHPAVKEPLADSFSVRGDEMLASSNLLGAEQFFEKAYKYSPTDENYHKLIDYYDKAGQSDKASLLNKERSARFGKASIGEEEEPESPPVEQPAPAQAAAPQPATPNYNDPLASPAPSTNNPNDPLQPAATSAASGGGVAVNTGSAQQTAFEPCPSCKKPKSSIALLCPHCGYDVRKAQAGYYDSKAQVMKKTWQETTFKVITIIYLVFSVLALVTGAVTGDFFSIMVGLFGTATMSGVLAEQTWAHWVAYIVTILYICFHGFLFALFGLASFAFNPIVGILVSLFLGAFLAVDILYFYLLKYNGDLI